MKAKFVFVYPFGSSVGRPAGRLDFLDQNTLAFTYGKLYIQSPDAVPVDIVNLPLSDKTTYLKNGCFGSIRDAAPDLWGQLVLAKTLGKSFNNLELFDLFSQSDSCRIGNLDFRDSIHSEEPETVFPAYADIGSLQELSSHIENDNSIPEKLKFLLPLLCQGSSIGGARPKSTIFAFDKLWIAKFPTKYDVYEEEKVEYATMLLAALCDIDVPDMRLVNIGGKDVLLVERFDRIKKEEHKFGRIGYLSSLSLINGNEFEYKYFSYLTIAEELRRWNPKECKVLFRRMLFNILCRNTDDHPKNHGFLIDPSGQLRLSPAFDITPTIAEFDEAYANQAMSTGIRGPEGSIENALSRCEIFGLDKAEAQSIVYDLLRLLPKWKECFTAAGVDTKTRDKFAYTFEGRWKEKIIEAQENEFITPVHMKPKRMR